MVNIDLLWYLLVPIVLSAVSIFVFRSQIPGANWAQSVGVAVMGLLISAGITSTFFYLGKGSRTHDTEILNGEVLSKDRRHGHYLESYDCHCYSYSTGTGKNRTTYRHCDTCYRDHYTVKWSCNTNIGDYTIESLDRTSDSVYSEPDPQRYTIIKPGDPVSQAHEYTNYIKAVPDTLFRPTSDSIKQKYLNKIPAYPDTIYDFYHVDRVLTDGTFTLPNQKQWNERLSEILKKLGPQNQANAVIVITKDPSENYFYALQDAWLNGKKNDIVIVIGAPDFPNIAWVRIMALTTREIFQVKLHDSLMNLKVISIDGVMNTIDAEVKATFKRKHMRDFAYLDAEIDPPTWVMMTCMILISLAYVGFWIFVYSNNESHLYNRFGAPRFRY